MLTETSSDNKLIGVFVSKSDKSLGHIAYVFSGTRYSINVYDENLKLNFRIRDLYVKKMIQVDDTYYCMLGESDPDVKKEGGKYERATGNYPIRVV